MMENKLFLEELKVFVEKGLTLNEYDIEYLQGKFDKSLDLINQLYQLLVEQHHMLPIVSDIEADVYCSMIGYEIEHGRTFYGASLAVAERFQIPQTYVKYKIKDYNQPRVAHIA